MNEITTQATEKTVKMSRTALHQFHIRIKRLNKRAARIGVPPISLSVNEWYSHEFDTGKVIDVADVTVSLSIPVRPDWQFAATLDHSHELNVLRTAPGFDKPLPEKFRTCGTGCEECNKNRYRKDTFVLHHTDGTFRQVGRDCLLSYLPLGLTPEKAADYAEWISSVTEVNDTDDDFGSDDFGGGYSWGSDDRFSLDKFLSFVTASAKERGFRTRKQAEETESESTRSDAMFSMFPPRGLSIKDREKLLKPTDEDREWAQTIIEWAKNLEGKTDFDHNMKVIGSSEAITYRDGGLAAYLYQAHQKHLGWVAKRKEENAGRPESVHVGELKVRMKKQTITYTGCPYSGDTDWGYVFIYKFTIDGNDLVWKTGSEIDCNPGDVLLVDFTPVEHGEFRDRPQTKINRVKIHSITPKE
jgi:hypothetical protein